MATTLDIDARIAAAEHKRKVAGLAEALGGPSPCEGCPHAVRCRDGLACAALQLFVQTGRISEIAPRQPTRQIYERLFT
jgi:hypothetical protein